MTIRVGARVTVTCDRGHRARYIARFERGYVPETTRTNVAGYELDAATGMCERWYWASGVAMQRREGDALSRHGPNLGARAPNRAAPERDTYAARHVVVLAGAEESSWRVQLRCPTCRLDLQLGWDRAIPLLDKLAASGVSEVKLGPLCAIVSSQK
jgi:hypothetical protein